MNTIAYKFQGKREKLSAKEKYSRQKNRSGQREKFSVEEKS